MSRPTALLRRLLIAVHRWLGVALSLLFLLWFASGIVMMYWTFPAVTERDRLQRAPVIEPAQVALTPEEAFAAAGRDETPRRLHLTTFDGRPVYRAAGFGGPEMVFADNGTVPPAVDDAVVDRAAEAWTGLPADRAEKILVREIDQWTVGGDLRSIEPLYKYSFPDGQQVYIDGNAAQVVQYTTASSRFWAYLGAIPHWLYFTPIRRHSQEWFSLVVWSSLIGTVSVLFGLVIAVWMYSPAKRYRHAGAPTSIPYRGWKRWHTVAGLIFGLATLTWTFSGLLSMGPFPLMDRLAAIVVPSSSNDAAGDEGLRRTIERHELEEALRGPVVQPPAFSAKHPQEALASLSDFEVKEIEYTSFDGQPVYLASDGRETRIVPVHGEPRVAFDQEAIMRIVRRTAGESLADLRVIEDYDAYYLDRRGERPLPVIYARLNDAAGSRFYIDPRTARVVGSYSARDWVARWLYRGLHSLDFPWLYKYRPLWDIVVITLMLGGTALCLTSLVLAWRVITRTVTAAFNGRSTRPDEDLA